MVSVICSDASCSNGMLKGVVNPLHGILWYSGPEL
jgi:hypothetical protein